VKQQPTHRIRAHLLRSAVYLLLLLAVCVIPFALGQRLTIKRSMANPTVPTPQLLHDLRAVPEPTDCGLVVGAGLTIGFPADHHTQLASNIVSYTFANSQPAPNDYAIFQTHNPWGATVVENAIIAAGHTFAVFTPNDLTGFNFSEYRVIILNWDDTLTSAFLTQHTAAIPALQTYVNGGGVVWVQGAIQGNTGDCYPLPFGGESCVDFSYTDLIVDPSSPMVQGVPNPILGTYASHVLDTSLPAEAHVVVVTCADQNPVLYDLRQGASCGGSPTPTPTATPTPTPTSTLGQRTTINPGVPTSKGSAPQLSHDFGAVAAQPACGLLVADGLAIGFGLNHYTQLASNVVSYTFSQSQPAPNDYAIFQTHNPWGATVVENAITANGHTFTVFTPDQLAGFSFSAYRVIVLNWDDHILTDFLGQYTSAIPALRLYVNGGGVVWVQGAMQGNTGDCYPLPFGGESCIDFSYTDPIVDPSSPIVQGVPNPIVGNYASHVVDTSLPAEAHVVVVTCPDQNSVLYDLRQGTSCGASPTPTPTVTPTPTPTSTPRVTPTPRAEPTPRPRPTPAPRPGGMGH
jgi:hypothetical protein